MTEQTDRAHWDLDRRLQHDRELRRKREQWERGRQMNREAERLSGLRAEMDRYRAERLTAWMEHGGSPESFNSAWPSMMKDYLDGKQTEAEAERAKRLARAEAEYDF